MGRGITDMARVMVCYKWVVDEADLKPDPTGARFNLERVAHKISDYDRNAIEAGAALIEQTGGECIALSAGGADLNASIKDTLSRGPDSAVLVIDEALAQTTADVYARVLAAAIKHLGVPDVLLFGEGASDDYEQQVGPRVAQLLGLPCLSYASELRLEGDTVRVVRKTERLEHLAAQTPVVVTVTDELNKPRIPGLKQIMGASKKPVQKLGISDLALSAEDLVPALHWQNLQPASMNRKNQRIDGGDLNVAVDTLVRILVKEGLLS